MREPPTESRPVPCRELSWFSHPILPGAPAVVLRNADRTYHSSHERPWKEMGPSIFGLSPSIPVRSKRLEPGFPGEALHSCSESSAMERVPVSHKP